MKKFAMLAAAVLFAAAPLATAADKTLEGTISDARCNGKHSKTEHSTPSDDHECTTKCVAGGQKYVFVSGGKTYQIANQDFAELKAHGGHKVALTGDLKDDSITVSKIVMPKEDAKKK